jgi:thioredoxin reductase (NADPH)
MKYDCVIIGSGPAGLTAAIYHARADVKTVVVAGNQPGGQLTITPMVENYPGFTNGVGGFKLMMDMQTQVKNLGVEIRSGIVSEVRHQKSDVNFFEVILENGEILESKSVIVATGAKVKWLDLPREKDLIGKGVSSCATCDGMFFRDKTVAVVGGGDTACEDAAFLSKMAKKVFMIHRREEFRASIAEQEKVLNNEKIEILWNSEVKELIGENKLESIKIINNKTSEEKILPVDGLFVAVGYNPATEFLKELVDLKESGQVAVDEKMMSNMEGVFAAGDCVNVVHRQAVIAAGDGSKAALEVQNWLKHQ